MMTLTIKADEENNAELFWANLDEQLPDLAHQLREGEVRVDEETWNRLNAIEGFSDGPAYAQNALIEL